MDRFGGLVGIVHVATLGRRRAVELGPHQIRGNNVVATWMWGPPVQGYVAARRRAAASTSRS